MPSWIRGRENFAQGYGVRPSPVWEAIENAVREVKAAKPFDPIEISTTDDLHYLPSQIRPHRVEIGVGHSRYQSGTPSPQALHANGSLGPVELDILGFAASGNPMLAVLVGGMGSGKSTTIRYLIRRHLSQYKVILCDLDANIDAAGPTDIDDTSAAKILSRYLSSELNLLITPEVEYKNLWTWALSGNGNASHPAKYVLSNAQDRLRDSLGKDWQIESEAALEIRRQCRSELFENPLDKLTYQGLLIDYYLTCCCNNDRSRLLLVLDNIDPLPPRRQFQMLDLASRLQASARCKVLLSLRPLTYSSNLQGAHRLIEIIEHAGPSVIDLIASRMRTMVLDSNLSKIAVRLHDDGRVDRTMGQLEAKRWVEEVMQVILREQRQPNLPGEPAARAFIEGICGHSLRSALVVAPKIFGSASIPVVGIPEGDSSRHRPRVRDHDVIRAVLDDWHGYYSARPTRITDNIFDLGETVPSKSCTSKIRLLKLLAASNNGIATVGEIRQHLACYGYNDQLILDSVNGIVSQSKRLAWSDSVAQYDTLDGFQSTAADIQNRTFLYGLCDLQFGVCAGSTHRHSSSTRINGKT